MWVVEYWSPTLRGWWAVIIDTYETEDEALVKLVEEKFRDPDWKYRIVEVPD